MADLRSTMDALIDRGQIPDQLLRAGIKGLLFGRLVVTRASRGVDIEALWDGPVTIAIDDANRQHYTVPDEFFKTILGPHLKYSSAVWPQRAQTLTEAEEAALSLTCKRADLKDGHTILELGCGWGSLTLWMASAYPAASITAVSNSATQRAYIMTQAANRGLHNVNVVTRDIGTLNSATDPDVVSEAKFDRIVSVEMLEHVRNHRVLGRRLAGWLKHDGSLFVHVFAHQTRPYLFDVGTNADWMARHFFTGGMMPSVDLLPRAFDQLTHQQTWWVNGRHYATTLAAWRRRLDANRDQLVTVLQDGEPNDVGEARFNRWRVFLIACEELFAFGGGRQWGVVHQRFTHPLA